MRLKDFEREPVGEFHRYTAALSDDRGERAYQVQLVGADQRIKKIFAKSEFDVTISPDVDQEEWVARAEKQLGMAELVLPADAFDDLTASFPEPPRKPSAKNSVVCALRRERPGGTGFALVVPLVVPAGVSVFFAFPPAFVCGGAVLPVSGNPDLFLNANSLVAPPVARSTFAGTTVDAVRFATSPFAQFFPIFRVFGTATSVATFVGASFGLP
jgi:hypothetical protein